MSFSDIFFKERFNYQCLCLGWPDTSDIVSLYYAYIFYTENIYDNFTNIYIYIYNKKLVLAEKMTEFLQTIIG